MSRASKLADHIERTVTGPMWHGPALAAVLEGVTAERALARPIPNAHNIWELVLHVIAWVEIARARLRGQSTGDPSPDEDWPRVTSSDAASWSRALDRLAACHRELAAEVRGLDDRQLEAMVANLDYSVSVLLRGIVEHGTYHGGQMALLKKA